MHITSEKISNEHFKSIPILTILLFISFDILFRLEGVLVLFGLIYLYFLLFLLIKHTTLEIPNIFFVFWIIYASVQMLWIDYTELTLLHYQVILLGFILIWLISNFVNSVSMLELLFKLWGVAVLGTIVVAWWEIITGNHIVYIEEGRFDYENFFATVNYYNPNNYSFFLSVCFPVILYWIKRLGIIYKVLGILMLISTFYIIFLNGSRISLFILIIAIMPILISFLKRRKKLIILLFFALIPVFIYFMDSIIETLTIETSDDSLNQRIFLYESALKIFLNHPLGVGPGSLESYMPIIGSNVHNFWLEILVNYGFIIFFCMVFFFCKSIKKLYYASKSEELSHVLKPILWSVLIFIPTSLSPSSIFTFDITWFIFALIVTSNKIINKYEVGRKCNL